MNVLGTRFVQGFTRVCDDGFQQNWHERDGGNLSYRLKKEKVEAVRGALSYKGGWQPIGTSVSKLDGEYLMVSGNGKFIWNMILDPEVNNCIIEVDEVRENYCIYWGLRDGGRPTSEPLTHLTNHEARALAMDGRYRVIYHAHPANIIALTFVPSLTDEVSTRELWEMAMECLVVFPSGVGVVGWMAPGDRDTAVAISKLMKDHGAAVWAHHGLSCAGEDSDLIFGLTHTIEKSAEILVEVMSIRPDKRQAIMPEGFRNLAEDFRVSLPEKFLYKKQK